MIRKYFLFTIVSLSPFYYSFYSSLIIRISRAMNDRSRFDILALHFQIFNLQKLCIHRTWLENAFHLWSCHFLSFIIHPWLFEQFARSIETVSAYFQIFNIQKFCQIYRRLENSFHLLSSIIRTSYAIDRDCWRVFPNF